MITELQKRTRHTGIRLIMVMALFMLSGIALALMIRKEENLRRLQASHRAITANLPRMVDDTRHLQEQILNFRRLVPPAKGGQSTELLLFSRLDQVKAALPSAIMTTSALEKKDGAASVGFMLKMPLQEYAAAINSLGKLQTETFPFVVVKKATLDTVGNGQFSIEGAVIMPLTTEGGR